MYVLGMEGDVVVADLLDDPSGKSRWAPVLGFAAGVVVLAAFVGLFLCRPSGPAPVAEPGRVLEPAGPVAAPVAAAPVRRPEQPGLHIRATGRTKVSSVGPAPEPPPMVVADDPVPTYRRGGVPIHVAVDPNAPQRTVPTGRESRRQGGVTYREAVSGDRDPLLPFGSGSGDGGTSGRGASFSRQ